MIGDGNGLSPREVERLAVLARALGDTGVVVARALIDGLDATDPATPYDMTNAQDLGKQLGYLVHAIDLLVKAGDVEAIRIEQAAILRAKTLVHFLHHQ